MENQGNNRVPIADPEAVLPRVMHILPGAVGGGMARFVRDLCDSTAHFYHHFVLHVTTTSWLIGEARTASYRLLPAEAPQEILRSFANLGLVIVHLHSSAPTVIRAARLIREASGAALAVTLHDVLFAEPYAFQADCWSRSHPAADPDRRELLSSAAFLTAPSHFLSDLARNIYGVAAWIVPNGISPRAAACWDDDGEVNVGGSSWIRRLAVLGALGGHKGGDQLFDIVHRLPSDIVMVVIGFLDGQLGAGWADQHHKRLADHPGASRIFVTGPYAPSDLPDLFLRYRPHLVYFPGRIPESFSYTLSEVWTSGGIPVVPELGALGERTTDEIAVRLADGCNIDEVVLCLDNWSSPPFRARRQTLRAAIRKALPDIVPTLHAMANNFSELYQRFSSRLPAPDELAGLEQFSTLCEMNLDPTQFRSELTLLLEENQILRDQDMERARWNTKLEADIAKLGADIAGMLTHTAGVEAWNAKLEADIAGIKAHAAGVEAWNAKLEADMANMKAHTERVEAWNAKLEADMANMKAHTERVEAWNARLEADIAGMKANSAQFDEQIVKLEATLHQQRKDLAEKDARMAQAQACFGDDETVWSSYGRLVRLFRRIPGLLVVVDSLAALRRRIRARIHRLSGR